MTAAVTSRASAIYQDALCLARLQGNAELLNHWSSFAYAIEPDGSDVDPVVMALDGERYRAFDEELRRRVRLAEKNPALPPPRSLDFEKWRRCADMIRERCDVPDFYQRLGFELKPTGSNSSRGAREFAGRCPVCGGVDRLRAWSGPRGRVWCRQCRLSMDAIGLAQVFTFTYQLTFFDAVRHLAEFLGITPPTDDLPTYMMSTGQPPAARKNWTVRVG